MSADAVKRSLAEAYPTLAAQWHPTKNEGRTPDEFLPGSKFKAWWQCAKDTRHEWQATITNRANGSGCSVCTGKTVLPGVNDLATTHPHVHALLDVGKLDSSQHFSAQSNKRVWWKCPQGHEWDSTVLTMARGTGQCPVCTNYRVVPGVNDLATTHPDIAAMWSPENANSPERVTASSTKKVAWVCALGHTWEQKVRQVAEAQEPCPYCSNRLVLPGFNDLATVHPEVARDWIHEKNLPTTPDQVTAGAKFVAWWRCANGHEWQTSVAHRTKRGDGCPYCSRQRVNVGESDLQTLRPDLAAQWDDSGRNELSPSEVTPGSNISVWWKCPEGHSWKATTTARVRGEGCSVCSARTIVPGVNDLATANPKLAAQWHPTKNGTLTPSQVAPFRNSRAWWRCENGHEWEALISSRQTGCGCPVCAARSFASAGEKELAELLGRLGLNLALNIRRKLDGTRLELDAYFPDHNFAVEFNGTYWHSEAGGKGRDYHRRKYQACASAGITLFQVWEDDWKLRKPIVLRAILHRLGETRQLAALLPEVPKYYYESIGARKLRFIDLDYKTAAAFMDEHHLQGSAVGTAYLGLADAAERVRAVMIVKRSSNSGTFYIERYATAGVVQGGFTRLLRHAESRFAVATWVTFADLSVSQGRLYEDNGFVVDKILPPDYMYFVQGERVHKFNYRLKRFREDPNLIWKEGLTERELARLNGLHRIWDSGKVRYVKNVER